jgi:hypothetical protein
MPLTHVVIAAASDPAKITQNVQQAFGTLVTQLNAQAGKLQGTLNAQGNTISNLPAPTNSGDPVTLGFLQNAIGTLTSSINNTLNRSQNGYRNRAKPYHCIFKAAVAQNGTALMGMNWTTSSSTGTGTSVAPTGTVISVGGLYFAGMAFAANNIYVQDHFPLPEDWVPSSLDCIVTWYAPDGGGDGVTWTVQLAHATNLAAGAQVFNSASSVAASTPAGPEFAISTITNVLVTTNSVNTDFQPGDEVFFKFGASGISGTAVLVDLKFLVRRQGG